MEGIHVMNEKIVEKLRACPSKDREGFAMALAHTKNDAAVSELERIVEGNKIAGL